jgi:hypothetical protein
MRVLISALAFIASTAVADELHSVDPKTVIDGDTFYVSVRLLGVDAPERGDRGKCDQERALSGRATEPVKELLHGRVTLDVHDVDECGRLLANVRLSDGETWVTCCFKNSWLDRTEQDSIQTGVSISPQPVSASSSACCDLALRLRQSCAGWIGCERITDGVCFPAFHDPHRARAEGPRVTRTRSRSC